MPSLVQTIRDMQEAAMTARQKKAIAAIEKNKKLSDSEKFKKIDAVMNEEEQIDEFHAPGMAPKPKKKPSPSSTKKSLGDISKRANEDKKICESCGKVHEGSCMEEKTKCPKCEGKGCDHCGDTGYHEETQVDEISKKKLGDYVKKASKDAASKSAYGAQLARDGDTKKAGKMTAKAYDRTKKIGKAVDRLTKEEIELEEDMMAAGKELEAYARKNGGIDKNDFMKAAVMMKKGQKKQLMKFVDELDTEPREKILSVISQNEEVEMEEGRMKGGLIHDAETMSKAAFLKKHGKENLDTWKNVNEDVDSLAKDFEARLKKQGYSSRTQDRERMATLAKAKKQGMNAMQMKQLDSKMTSIMNKMDEAAVVDTQATHSMDLLDTVNAILMGRRDELDEAKMDKVDKKALKKDYDDRKDKDIDNDGDEDDSDEYLHNKRKAVSKAIDKKDDAPKKKAKKPESQAEPVDVEPTLGEMMTKLESKREMFESKYGDRAQKVMEATAAKMVMRK